MGIEPTTSRKNQGKLRRKIKVGLLGFKPTPPRPRGDKLKSKEKKENEVLGDQSHIIFVLMNEKNKGRNQGKNETMALGLDLGSPHHVDQTKINKN